MKFELKGHNYLVLLSLDENLCLSSVLNEVLHGFRVPEFDQTIGLSRQEALDLHKKLSESRPEGRRVEITLRQLVGLRHALAESLEELGVEEFHTRVGMPFQEGKQLGIQIDRAIQSASAPPSN